DRRRDADRPGQAPRRARVGAQAHRKRRAQGRRQPQPRRGPGPGVGPWPVRRHHLKRTDMASLATSGLTLPKHLASGLWAKAQTGSTVAALSNAEPMLFGETQLMTFTTPPKAQYVAEGGSKSGTDPAF